MRTILEICRDVADLVAVERPKDLFNENDELFRILACETLTSLSNYGNWDELTKIFEIKPYISKQFKLKEIINDFKYLQPATIFIKDGQERVIGAIPPQNWQTDKKCVSGGVSIRIKNNVVCFVDNIPNNIKIVFQYQSNSIVWDFDNFEEKTVLEKNTDVPIFDEYLVKLGILWRWLKYHKMNYDEEYQEYERELKKRYIGGLIR